MDDLVSELAQAEHDFNNAKMRLDVVKEQILEANKAAIEAELSKRQFPTGTVNVGKIKFTIPKTVKWDQDELDKLYKDGANEYIKVKYDVSERDYDQWSDNIKKYFDPARTVVAGKPQIKIMEEQND